MWASMYLLSQEHVPVFSSLFQMWNVIFKKVFISFSFLSVNFPADVWLVDSVSADMQECIPKHGITLSSIPWHLILCGLGPLFLLRFCSRSSKAGGTALALLLVHSWGFFRGYLWVSGSLRALERRCSGACKIVTCSICNNAPEHLETISGWGGVHGTCSLLL